MKRLLTTCLAAAALCALSGLHAHSQEAPQPPTATPRPLPGENPKSDAGVTGDVASPRQEQQEELLGIAPPPPVVRRQVQLDVVILRLDWQKLEAAGIDVAEAIDGTAPAHDPTSSSPGGRPASPGGRVTFLRTNDRARAQRLIDRLHSCGAASIVSRSSLITADGRRAELSALNEAPVAQNDGADADGHAWKHRLGTALEITPSIVAGRKLSLDILATDIGEGPSQRVDIVDIETSRGTYAAESGEVLVLVNAPANPTESGAKTAESSRRPRMMLFVTPTIIGSTAPVPAPPAERPSASRRAGTRLLGIGLNSDAGLEGTVKLPGPPGAFLPPSPPAEPPRVRFDVLLLRLDWRKLQDAGIDLRALIGGQSQEAPRQIIATAAGREHSEAILRKLTQTQCAQVLSRPSVITLDGQAANLEVLSETGHPVVLINETVNGRPRRRVETPHVGQTVCLTPTVLDGNQLAVAISAESRELVPVEHRQDGELPPALDVRLLRAKVTLGHDQRIVLAELPPGQAADRPLRPATGGPPQAEPGAKTNRIQESSPEHGLMLVVVPQVLASTVPRQAVYPHVVDPAKPPTASPQFGKLAGAMVHSLAPRWPDRIELRKGEMRVLASPTGRRVVRVDGFDPRFLEVQAADSHRLRLRALEKGRTLLHVTDEQDGAAAIDVFVHGDTRLLEGHLERLYPQANLSAIEVGDAVVLRGRADSPEQIRGIIQIAEQLYPRVISQLQPPPSGSDPAQPSVARWATAANPRVAETGRRLEHLRQAARSLEAAGLHDQASKVSAQAVELDRELARLMQPRVARLAAEHAPGQFADLHQEIRELRGEVQELRRDVGRLLKLLEQQATERGEPAAKASGPDSTRAGLPPAARLEGGTGGAGRAGLEFNLPIGARRRAQMERHVAVLLAKSDELFERGLYSEAERVALDAFRLAAQDAADPWRAYAGYLINIPALPEAVADTSTLPSKAHAAYFKARAARRSSEEPPADLSPPRVQPDDDAAARIRRRLDQPITLAFDKSPLSQALKEIARIAGVNVVIDKRGLEEEGVSPEAEVSLNVEGVALNSALELILQPLRLAYQLEDQVLKITGRQRARGPLHVRNYAVADLVPRESSAATNTERLEALGELITKTIEPDTWSEAGGVGTVRPFEATSSLVIRQTADVHEETADLLHQLRRHGAEEVLGMRLDQARPQSDPDALHARAYRVADLVNKGPVETRLTLEQIGGVIQDTVRPDDWAARGGAATLQPWEATNTLVIRQTAEAHRDIAGVLDQLRRRRALAPPATAGAPQSKPTTANAGQRSPR